MKTMESSTVVVFRALVMLACLVLVPLAAILGSAFPDVVKSMLVDRIFPPQPAQPNGRATGGAAQRRASATRPKELAPLAKQTADASPHPIPRGATESMATGGVRPDANANSGRAAVFHEPAARAQTPGAPRQSLDGRADRGFDMEPTDPRRAPKDSSAPRVRDPHDRFAGQLAASAPNASQTDRFSEVQRKLREYGATYYLLETWGNEGSLYRFHCKMAVGGSAATIRQFEATDSDAMRAMAKVLEQVEAWRGQRQP